MMLDGPCSFHTKHPSRPSNHTTRNCSWYQHKPESAGPVTRPAPVTGANAIPVITPARPVDNRARPQDVNQVADLANTNNNPNAGPSQQNQYREPHQSYMVFVTEPTYKQSLTRVTWLCSSVRSDICRAQHQCQVLPGSR